MAPNDSNYLSPRLGFLSADSWTLAGTYLCNLLLNWLVLLPLLIVPLLAPRVLIALTQMNAADVPDRGLTIFITAGLGFGAMARIYLHLFRPNLQEFRTNNSWKLLETQALVPEGRPGSAAPVDVLSHRQLGLVSKWAARWINSP